MCVQPAHLCLKLHVSGKAKCPLARLCASVCLCVCVLRRAQEEADSCESVSVSMKIVLMCAVCIRLLFWHPVCVRTGQMWCESMYVCVTEWDCVICVLVLSHFYGSIPMYRSRQVKQRLFFDVCLYCRSAQTLCYYACVCVKCVVMQHCVSESLAAALVWEVWGGLV